MSLIQFPYEPESQHPQYLYNEQEFIMRMLMQHSIGISLEETASQVTVSHNPVLSHNFTAHGAADFPSRNISAQFSTSSTRWIYLRANGNEFYLSSQQPSYNQYLHGWYHPTLADRAVVFIDSEQPANYRCFIMDTYNSMYEYNSRIADTGGDLFFHKGFGSVTDANGGTWSRTLLPGRYRFEIRAGKGGNGGTSGYANNNIAGGVGALGQIVIHKLTIISRITINGYVGFDGSHGENGKYKTAIAGRIVYDIATGGGGGSSGENTFIQIENSVLAEAIGGAGGGGSNAGNYAGGNLTGGFLSSGAGGGGAGFGVGGNGKIKDSDVNAGLGGTVDNGGAGQQSVNGNGLSGQNRGTLRRRNGGNSPSWGGGVAGVNVTVDASLGGTSILNTTQGYIKIIRTGDIAA